MLCATFNVLAHPYTKHNSEHHGHAARALESETQRNSRYARNAAVIAAVKPQVLLLQEHDADFVIPRYRPVVRAFGAGRSEGTSILVADDFHLKSLETKTWDIGDGKSAAAATLDGRVYVSVHLKGGPGSDASKTAQVTQILKDLLPSDAPIVFAGDLNESRPDTADFNRLLCNAGFTRVPYTGCSGFNGGMTMPIAIDHVYVRGVSVNDISLPYEPNVPWADTAVVGSDHVPVVFTAR